jgi:GAF domain-containing protein
MKCPRCQQENPSHAKLCLECGAPVDEPAPIPKSYADLQGENEGLRRSVGEAMEQQTATAEILRVISSSPMDVQPVFEAIVASAARLCDAVDGTILRVEGDKLVLVAHEGPIPSLPVGPFGALTPGRRSARAVLEARTIHVVDLQAEVDEYPEGSALARSYDFRTVLSVPLIRAAAAIGVIVIRRTEARPFTERQTELLKTFADQAVIALENVRLFKETKEALEQQTATSEILRVIGSSPTDAQPVFDVIVRNAARLCGAVFSGVALRDGDQLTLPAAHGLNAADLETFLTPFPIRLGADTVTGHAILEGRVVHVRDQAAEPAYARNPGQRVGTRSIVAVPMFREGSPIGAISVWRQEVRPFTDAQIDLLKTFANQAVIAIENARLFTELQEKNLALTEAHAQVTEALEQQTATAEILRVISRSPIDVLPVFDVIVETACRLCDGVFANAVRFDGELMHNMAQYGFTAEAREALIRAFPMGPTRESMSGRAILNCAVVQSEDTSTDDEATISQQLSRLMGFRAQVSVPMLREGVPVGAITVARRERGPFPARQVALLQTFADQAVIALENVRLFKELAARNRDLTEANARVTEALERQTATSEILRAISSSPTDAQPVFDTIVRSAARLCHAVMASVLLTDGRTLYLPANYGSSPEALAAVRARFPRPLDTESVSGAAILTRSVVHVPDVLEPSVVEFTRQAGQVLGYRSLVTVPMLREGRVVGAINVCRREPGRFSDAEVELLKTFADQAVIAIENVRLFTELGKRNHELTEALEQQTATSEILRTITHTQTDTQPVFDTIVRSAAQLCHAAVAAVFLTDGRMVYHPANYGGSPEALAATRARFPRRLDMETMPGMAILTRSVVNLPDIEDPSVTEHVRQVGGVLGFRSALAVPMLREGEAVGAITAHRREPGRFLDAEVELLKTFADQAVIAVENVRLFTELEARTAALTRSVDQLTALGEVGRAVSSSLDLETVLTTIVSRAVQLSRLDGGVVFEYDDRTEEFVHRVATEAGAALAAVRRATRVQKGEGVVGRTAITLEPVQVPDITVAGTYDSRLRENLIESGVRAILAVPMVREDQLIGCLVVSRNRPGDFSAETIELLRTFATQSALAIQNARLFRELADKSRQLEVASQHKSEFLANMSHELRTPLNAVIGFSEVLTERMFGELNEKQDEYVRDIYASGTHLLSLINDILDLSKIEAGRMELELADFHLPQAIENALVLVRERALRRGITLEQSIDPRLGEIQGDERKIKQVLLNLLSNALKFTPEGGRVEVCAGVVDNMAEISVIDTGVGIAPEDHEAVFEEFRQVGAADKRVEGTGLGLALARKFIELHGGRIWVESQVAAGSTFTFTLPVLRGE